LNQIGFFLALLDAPSSLAILLLLAIAPSIFLLWFFYNQDRYKHESKKLLIVTFLLGALMILPAIFIELFLKLIFPEGDTIAGVFLFYLFDVALVEESLKLFAVRIYAYKSKMFNEPMDGLILGVAAALGFATVENIFYVLQSGLLTGIVRAIVSVPSHALYGAILGFYLGEAKFRKRPMLALQGLAFAILLHAIFDTITTVIPSIIGVIALVAFVLVLYYRVVKGEIREAEEESPFKPRRFRGNVLRQLRSGNFFGRAEGLILHLTRKRKMRSGPLAQPGRALEFIATEKVA
jgi:protease PrsW